MAKNAVVIYFRRRAFLEPEPRTALGHLLGEARGKFKDSFDYIALCHDVRTADTLSRILPPETAEVFLTDAVGQAHSLAELFDAKPALSNIVLLPEEIAVVNCDLIAEMLSFHRDHGSHVTSVDPELSGVWPVIVSARSISRVTATRLPPQPEHNITDVVDELSRAGAEGCVLVRFAPKRRRNEVSPLLAPRRHAPQARETVLYWSAMPGHPESALEPIASLADPQRIHPCFLRLPDADRFKPDTLSWCNETFAAATDTILHLEASTLTPVQVTAYLKGVPIVLSVPEYMEVQRECLELADLVLCSSEHQRKYIVGLGLAGSTAVVFTPGWIRALCAPPIAQQTTSIPHVLIIGPVSKDYGQEILMEALGQIRRKVSGLQAFVVNESIELDESYELMLRTLIIKHRLQQNVCGMEGTSKRDELWTGNPIVVFCGRKRSMCNLLWEVIGRGAIPLGPEDSWFSEACPPDVRATYCFGNPGSLAEKLLSILSNKDLQQGMLEAGTRHIGELRSRLTSEAITEIYAPVGAAPRYVGVGASSA